MSSLLVACAPERFDEPICKSAQKLISEKTDAPFAAGFFPPEYAKPGLSCGYPSGSVPIVGEIESEWYPKQWLAASEGSYYDLAQCDTLPEFSLRFSYIPSFDPSVFIRIEAEGEGLKLIAKELTGAGGYDPGRLGRSKELRLTDQQAERLQKLLDAEALFQMPSKTCEMGFDGSQWIFEMVDKDGYKMVNRWSPQKGAPHAVGMYLVELSGWDLELY
ncbi:MAG: hypothetical protein V7676_18375 [Parasphingorhabdus sp.]|uniref:hypothetical protein n=1 Tax=Parasphingorhabdus sp. TaxID=2709688 RepID=UPI003001A588